LGIIDVMSPIEAKCHQRLCFEKGVEQFDSKEMHMAVSYLLCDPTLPITTKSEYSLKATSCDQQGLKMCIYIYIYMYTHTYIRTCVHTHMRTYVYTYT